VQNLYNHEGHITWAPSIAKGWTDVRDAPRPPKHTENFRRWFQNFEESKEAVRHGK
jgi:L-lactate dehydrogenase complex protein LldF